MKLAIIGATGLVGEKILRVLEEKNFVVDELIPVGSSNSLGKTIYFRGQKLIVVDIRMALEKSPDIALFSAGADVSKQWAKHFTNIGTFVIDNSSAWRMDPNIKLIVPEVNINCLNEDDLLIANPNCSTIQLVVALYPLYQKYGLKRIVVSTYQSVSGSGMKGLKQLKNERQGDNNHEAYQYQIDLNCIPQCDVFLENGYTKEEIKLIQETQKIIGDDRIKISSTAVRVPVTGGHSESVYIETERGFEIKDIYELLKNSKGIIVDDSIDKINYPMPYYIKDRDEVFVGRIRQDLFNPQALNLWIVADNLRKGAATNAVQIAEHVALKFINV